MSRRARKLPENISIEERLESVATREEFGHWEMDTIVSCVGGRGGVLIHVERQTRFAVTAKLNSLTKHDILQALKKVRGEMKALRSITTMPRNLFRCILRISITSTAGFCCLTFSC